MKERPILYNTEMVGATLDGRKTMTRRIVKPPKWALAGEWDVMATGDGVLWPTCADHNGSPVFFPCPYGVPGDQLWVREAWYAHKQFNSEPPRNIPANHPSIWYREKSGASPAPTFAGRYRHARFMCRWMSRITLEVKDVRVERLQEISADSVTAEGVQIPVAKDTGSLLLDLTAKPPAHLYLNEANREACSGRGTVDMDNWFSAHFASLWDSINAKKHPWSDNPWVWVVEFEVAK